MGILLPERLLMRFSIEWWAVRASNPRHPPCKGGALPAELTAHESPVLTCEFPEDQKEFSRDIRTTAFSMLPALFSGENQ